jgi:actin-related protein
MSDESEAIVLDNGSGFFKAGYAGEDTPRTLFPTCTGKVKNPEWFAAQAAPTMKADLRDRETFVGNECQQYRDYLEILNPINRGIVEDWDALEKVWEFSFAHELRINPETVTLPVSTRSSCPCAAENSSVLTMYVVV